MNAAQLGNIGVDVATVCVGVAALVVVVIMMAMGQEALARLWFRHRIEVIRDEAVTAVLDGILPLAGPVARWLATLEALEAIDSRSRRCDAGLGAAVTGARVDDGRARTWPGLTPAGRDIVTALTDRTHAAASSYLTWSGPAAWLLLARSGPAGPSPQGPRTDSVTHTDPRLPASPK